jgi:hypothetical protein
MTYLSLPGKAVAVAMGKASLPQHKAQKTNRGGAHHGGDSRAGEGVHPEPLYTVGSPAEANQEPHRHLSRPEIFLVLSSAHREQITILQFKGDRAQVNEIIFVIAFFRFFVS